MRKNWKKVVSAVLSVALIFSLSACGSSGDSKDSDKKSSKKDGYVVALCNSSLANTWRVQMQEEWEQEAKKLKEEGTVSDYIITNADGDITQQISDMEDLITKKVDLICISAASPTALAPVVEEAMDEGITVCVFDNDVDTDNCSMKLTLNNVEFAEACAEYVCETLGGKGKVIVLQGTSGTAVGDDRETGLQNVLKKYPDIEVIAEEWCDFDYAKAKSSMESLLSANSDIDGVISLGGAMTLAAIDAYEAAGRPLVPMSGEGQNGFLKVWANKMSEGFETVAPVSPTCTGSESLRQGIKILNGEKVEFEQYIDMPIVTKDNLSEYLREDLSDNYWPPCELPEEQLQKLYGENAQ